VKRCLVAVLLIGLALAGSPAVLADTTPTDPTVTTTPAVTTTPVVTTPAPVTPAPAPKTKAKHVVVKPKPATLPRGVRIAGVLVAHLTAEQAAKKVEQAFARPLTLVLDGKRVTLAPPRLAKAYVDGAVGKAKSAAPGTKIPLVVAVEGAAVRAAVAKLAKRVDRAPRQAQIELRNLKPYVAPNAYGRRLDEAPVAQKVVHQLVANVRLPMRVSSRVVEPRFLANGAAPIIVINRELNRLTLFDGTKVVRAFRVATGQSVYPTPRGNFHIVVKWVNPTWYPPTQDSWARGLLPVPPGPNNPLGTRWMGLSSPGVGIHGTDEPSSIGYSLSHGCIRMQVPDSEWLFNHVQVGTPVFIR
jgi:lipoprotein-anchoring transpeptidase ErfK/SrfK